MGKIRNWLIHKLGGYTPAEWNRMIVNWSRGRKQQLHPTMVKAACSYYVPTEKDSKSQDQMASEALANKIGLEMLENGLIHLIKCVDPIQDSPYMRYRMKATAWALDDTQMPCYGGDGK